MNRRMSEHKGTCTLEKNENMFWGPCSWKTIHTIAAAYDPSRKVAFLQFINSLPYLWPCEKCRQHMKENLRKFPPSEFLDSRDDLFLWSYRFHDLVNRSKDHPSKSPPFAEIKKYYYGGIYECENCKLN